MTSSVIAHNLPQQFKRRRELCGHGLQPRDLSNGAFVLRQPLQALGVPKTSNGPVSNEAFPIGFRQAIGATDALRTGTYSQTLTFTLSTTNP